MKAIILAAGRGKRMREYTNAQPKPLIAVSNTTLIERNILQLKSAGVTEMVINVSYMADQIMAALGNGKAYGVSITYSIETTALETGGGIKNALPLLSDSPFVVVSSDIWSDYDFKLLKQLSVSGAHLVLVKNPTYHLSGDFGLEENQVTLTAREKYTFASIALLHPKIFVNWDQGVYPLSHVLKAAIKAGQVTGEYYDGAWFNVGTPEELALCEHAAMSRV